MMSDLGRGGTPDPARSPQWASQWSTPTAGPPPPPPHGPDDNGPGSGQSTGRVVAITLVAVAALIGAGFIGWRLNGDDPAPIAAQSTEPTQTPPATVGTPSRQPDESTPAAPPSDESPGPSATPDPTTPGSTEGMPDLEDLLGELFGDGENPLEGLGGGGLVPDQQLLACLTPSGVQPSLQGSTFPDDPAQAIRTIGDQVARLRGLDFDNEVSLDLLTSEELTDRVVDLTREDYPVEDARTDEAILQTLGQVGPDVDLRETYLALLGEQVAGFYDPETGELTAESSGELAPTDMVIVSHELDHALTDQALGLPDLEAMQADSDAALAALGLVEGDASVIMQQWAVSHLSLLDQLSMANPDIATAALDSAPYVLQQQLLYPYTVGLEFVCSQYLDGGWDAVNAMYDNLPTTTAQVLWPERYESGEAALAVDPVTAGAGWEQLRSTTWGAADLLWLIEAPGNDPQAGLPEARDLAADWAGGQLTAWGQGDDTMVAVSLAQQPGGDLCTTMGSWYEAAFPEATADPGANETTWTSDVGAARIICNGDLVTVVLGPDLEAVATVA